MIALFSYIIATLKLHFSKLSSCLTFTHGENLKFSLLKSILSFYRILLGIRVLISVVYMGVTWWNLGALPFYPKLLSTLYSFAFLPLALEGLAELFFFFNFHFSCSHLGLYDTNTIARFKIQHALNGLSEGHTPLGAGETDTPISALEASGFNSSRNNDLNIEASSSAPQINLLEPALPTPQPSGHEYNSNSANQAGSARSET